jgi:hypothetical protein
MKTKIFSSQLSISKIKVISVRSLIVTLPRPWNCYETSSMPKHYNAHSAERTQKKAKMKTGQLAPQRNVSRSCAENVKLRTCANTVPDLTNAFQSTSLSRTFATTAGYPKKALRGFSVRATRESSTTTIGRCREPTNHSRTETSPFPILSHHLYFFTNPMSINKPHSWARMVSISTISFNFFSNFRIHDRRQQPHHSDSKPRKYPFKSIKEPTVPSRQQLSHLASAAKKRQWSLSLV